MCVCVCLMNPPLYSFTHVYVSGGEREELSLSRHTRVCLSDDKAHLSRLVIMNHNSLCTHSLASPAVPAVHNFISEGLRHIEHTKHTTQDLAFTKEWQKVKLYFFYQQTKHFTSQTSQ